jgi:uncharacterized protein YbaR (Trm112 family)
MMDTRLLEILVCPLCKGPLQHLQSEAGRELTCHADRLAFPVRDGIPVMLESEARAFDPDAQPDPLVSLNSQPAQAPAPIPAAVPPAA